MARKYFTSPPGPFVHPWINKPDTKFAPAGSAGVYKVGLKLSGAPAEALKEKVDAECQAAFDAYAEEKGLTPGEKKKWSVYYPYEVLEDDDGTPTGEIVFDFKQNAELTLKTGEKVRVEIARKDSKDKDMDPKTPIFGGTTGRIRYSMRPIPMVSTKQVGVRLDFAAVQVIKMAERSAGGGSFGAVEDDDAYVAGGASDAQSFSGDGDY